jgi:hypothetical protein
MEDYIYAKSHGSGEAITCYELQVSEGHPVSVLKLQKQPPVSDQRVPYLCLDY